MEFDPINTFGGDANPNESTRFENSVSEGSSSSSSGNLLSEIGNLLNGGNDNKDTGSGDSSSSSSGNLLSGIGNLLNGGNDNKDTGQKIQEITNIVKQGKQVVTDLREKSGGSISEIVNTVKGIADEEAKQDRKIGDYASDIGSMASTGGTIGSAAGSIVPGIGNAVVGSIGTVVGAVTGLAKNIVQDLKGPGKSEIAEDVEKKLTAKLKNVGIETTGISPDQLAWGYDYNEEKKAKEIGKLVATAEEFGEGAANFITKKFKNQSGRKTIQPGEPNKWVEEYMNFRTKLELSIERMNKSLTKIRENPEGSKKRAKDAYEQLVQLHKKHPHPNLKEAADKLLKKVTSAYKKQTSRMFGMTPDTQKKYLLYGGAAFTLIAVIVVIIVLMQKEK